MTPVLLIIVAHFLADFVMQCDVWAQGKSKSNLPLLKHVGTYTLAMAVMTAPLLGWYVLIWAPLNGALHFATDYVSSRLASKQFAAGNVHAGFVVIGADQVVHYACMLLTFPMRLL